MPMSFYQASVPVFVRMLNNLSSILTRAEDHAKTKKIDESVFMNARLAPDMLPLTKQIQIASDAVKGFGARVAGIEVPSFADTESTFAELQARIKKTIEFLNTLKAEQIDGGEEREVTLKLGGEERKLKGQSYLLQFALPNLFFHVTTAYGILRHNGVEIGKLDYLGGYPK